MEITDPAGWSLQTFRHSKLGDARRTTRLVAIGASMARSPATSLPRIFSDVHQLKATYRFLRNPAVTASGILSGAALDTVASVACHSRILLLADTSELDYSQHAATRDLGHVGNGGGTGLLFHTVVAATPTGDQVLGVLDQKTWTRRQLKGSDKDLSRRRRKRRRESERWLECAERAALRVREGLEQPPEMVLVTDREGDIFDLYQGCTAIDLGFVIRVAQKKRALMANESDGAEAVFDAVAQAPVALYKDVQIPSKPGRTARTARLQIRATTVTIRPPHALSSPALPVEVNLVCAEEVDAPRGVEPLQWILATDQNIETPAQILAIVRMYEVRWTLEDLHMAIKTGCAMEDRQLGRGHSLRNLLAIVTPIACQLLRLRQAARAPITVPASSILSATQLTVLRSLRPKLTAEPTAREALRWIANLGGFLMRKSDGEPGWRTIWKGFETLLIAETGFNSAMRCG